MSDIAMASRPNTPTARKSPVTSSPSSKGAEKAQQQRKVSVSQATSTAQQQRKNSTPRDSPNVVGQQRRESTAAKGSILAGNKKKDEEQSPTKVYLQVNAEAADNGTTHLYPQCFPPPKNRRISSAKPNVDPAQEPATTTLSQPPSAAPVPQTIQLLHHVLTTHPYLVPTSPSPILSSNIDAIAHIMWQVAFNHGPLLARACQYSAMFSPLKLAALAKLNFLPSWWFFGEGVMKGLPEIIGERMVDDGEM
ncbi:hypothetical protein AA0112_g8800 [Alternaria arborescens]|nr:hypothetical protein AA0112_g8800 [Alternaria arborescens]